MTAFKEEEQNVINDDDPMTEVDMTKFTPTYARDGRVMYFVDQQPGCEIIDSPTLGPFALIPNDRWAEFEECRERLAKDYGVYMVMNEVVQYYIANHTDLNIKELRVSEHVVLLSNDVHDSYQHWQSNLN